jgi:hypothetical protein
MIVATRVQGKLAEPAFAGRPIEWVTLDFHAMARSHLRVTTDAGTDLGISLPRGERLADGDVLHVDAERIVAVRARTTTRSSSLLPSRSSGVSSVSIWATAIRWRSSSRAEDELAASALSQDIAALRHANLYSRLCIS